MLEQLSASASGRRVEPGRIFIAAAFHGLVIFGAIEATQPDAAGSGAAAGSRVVDIMLDPAPLRQDVETSSASEATVEAAPPVDEFLAPPTSVPTGIPPLVMGPPLDLSRFRSAAVSLALPPGGSPAEAGSRIISAGDADEPAAVIQQPSPRYPPVLQQAGLEGRVLLEFVIDTAGHPEPASLKVIERTREGFDAAAMETIQHSLFRPARIRGQRVRQRTLQWVTFRIVSE